MVVRQCWISLIKKGGEMIQAHKINPSDFRSHETIVLDWCWISNNQEMVFEFNYNLSKDDVWYEIIINECDDSGDNCYVVSTQKFNSIHKACNYWNEVIDKNERCTN